MKVTKSLISQKIDNLVRENSVYFLWRFPIQRQKNVIPLKPQQGEKIVYSGDTGYFKKLKVFAINAELLVCEAGVKERFKRFGQGKHLTTRQAAKIAIQANIKQLLLTHIYPLTSYEVIKTEAQKVLADPKIAIEGKTYSV